MKSQPIALSPARRSLQTFKLASAAMLLALSVLLPLAFHSIPGAGAIYSPMHIPILFCSLLCGWPYGLLCGVFAPLLSSLTTGMPPAALLPAMTCELAVYGLCAGLFLQLLQKAGLKSRPAGLYCALIGAMLCGRAVSGLLNALLFQAGGYSLQLWLSAAFIKALPGILIQLVCIVPLILFLQRVKALRGLV